MTEAEARRYVLAECTETGETKCFGMIPPRMERSKIYGTRNKYNTNYYPHYGLNRLYTTDRGGDFSHLELSPFWSKPRLAKLEDIPKGVVIP